MDQHEIDERFRAAPQEPEAQQKCRAAIRAAAHVINDNTRPGRDQSNAVALLESALHWAICALNESGGTHV